MSEVIRIPNETSLRNQLLRGNQEVIMLTSALERRNFPTRSMKLSQSEGFVESL